MQTQDYRVVQTTGTDERVMPGEWTRVAGRVPCAVCGADYDDGHRRGGRGHRFQSSLAGAGVGTAAVKAVVQHMAARASAKPGEEGNVFVTDTELADVCGLSERTARRARERLIETGYLLLIRKGGGRAGRASDYRLAIPSVVPEHRPSDTAKHRSPETVISETPVTETLNTGHESAKHRSPEPPQEGFKRDTRGERGASPAGTSRPVVETPPTNTTTTNTPSTPAVAAAVRRAIPEQCERHQTGHHEANCGGCKRAREEHEAATAAAARAAAAAESEENRRRAELTRAEIARCRYCDPGGRRLDAPSMLCDHTPQQTERNKHGASAARAALARTSRGLAAVPEETLADACA